MSMLAPLKKVKGLGSAKEGTGHWWAQRISAVALVFLVGWLLYAAFTLLPFQYAGFIQFLRLPHNALLLILLMGAMLYHGYLGIQVVIEDYIHTEWFKIFLLVFLKLASIFAVAASVFSIFSIYLKG